MNDPIHPELLSEIYNEDYFSGDGFDDTVDYVENLSREAYFFSKYDYQIRSELVQHKLIGSPRWLDIGCAFGEHFILGSRSFFSTNIRC